MEDFMAIYGRYLLKMKNCHTPNIFVIREITGWYGNMAILERKIFKMKQIVEP